MNKFEELYEYVKNKQIMLDREIVQFQAKKDTYHDIELELWRYIDREEKKNEDSN